VGQGRDCGRLLLDQSHRGQCQPPDGILRTDLGDVLFDLAPAVWSGACWPASSHTRARAAARAALIVANPRGASLAMDWSSVSHQRSLRCGQRVAVSGPESVLVAAISRVTDDCTRPCPGADGIDPDADRDESKGPTEPSAVNNPTSCSWIVTTSWTSVWGRTSRSRTVPGQPLRHLRGRTRLHPGAAGAALPEWAVLRRRSSPAAQDRLPPLPMTSSATRRRVDPPGATVFRSARWLLAGSLLAGPLALTAPAVAADDTYSTPGNVLRIVGPPAITSGRSSSLAVSYTCTPTDGDVQLSVRFWGSALIQSNTWARFGYPFTPAQCDGTSRTAVLPVTAYPGMPDDRAGFHPGEQVTIAVDLTEYEPTQPQGPTWRAALAGARTVSRFPATPARCGAQAGLLTALAGTGVLGVAGRDGDGGAACDAQLAYPTSLARAADGTVYVADYLNSEVRRITPDGTITTVAGTGVPGFGGDGGPGTSARLNRPRGVALDRSGRLLIADNVNNRIRRLDPATGTITTIAGTGVWGSWGDGGQATAAQLAGPHGVAVGPDGTMYIADTGNARVRRVDPAGGFIGTLAGTGVVGGAGDGGWANHAQLSRPRALAVSGTTVFVADEGTSSVRRVSDGMISTLVGPSTGRAVRNPASLLPIASGLLVTEAGDNRVLRVDAVTGLASTYAGGAVVGDVPGLPRTVALSQPQGLAAGPDGTVLIADTGHHRLLLLSPTG